MNYIGIDVHKSICTAVVMNDDEKVVDQIIDFGTNDEGYSFIIDHYSPEDSYILFENLTTAFNLCELLLIVFQKEASNNVCNQLKPMFIT